MFPLAKWIVRGSKALPSAFTFLGYTRCYSYRVDDIRYKAIDVTTRRDATRRLGVQAFRRFGVSEFRRHDTAEDRITLGVSNQQYKHKR